MAIKQIRNLITRSPKELYVFDEDGFQQIVLLIKSLSDRFDNSIEDLKSEVYHTKEEVTKINEQLVENKAINFVGKKPKILDSAVAEVAEMSYRDIRNKIKRACKYQKELYDSLYDRLAEVTGVDVYAIGKTKLRRGDSVFEVTDNNYTYINTVFREGVHREAVAIALDMMRNG